ncbi:ROK family protein [Paenibacillus agaridevorans]|nr:ROK family protein [Paenibacillus agaridevorans]
MSGKDDSMVEAQERAAAGEDGMHVIGMDVGGTNIKAGIISPDGAIIGLAQAATPVNQGKEAILACMEEVVGQLRNDYRGEIRALGIGAAGRIDRQTGTVLYATDNLPGWMGTPLKSVMEARLSLPVFVDNDVNAAALGEGWLGAGREARHYVLLTLGTGVGGALVHDGKLISGPRGGVGEIGHMILYPGGMACNCGQTGCLEQYASGTALNRSAKLVDSGWDSRELLRQLELGHEQSRAVISRFVSDLATGLVSLQNLYDPELIIIGGGIMDTHRLWWRDLLAQLGSCTEQALSVRPAVLGNEAGLLGAARLALDEWNAGWS